MIWQMIGVFAGGVLFGFTVAMLMKARGMQSREEEMQEFYMKALEQARERAKDEAKLEIMESWAYSMPLPKTIINDPHFQNRLKQAGKEFSADYAKGIGL